MKRLFLIISLLYLIFKVSFAANVSCMFMSETNISKSGEWLGTESDMMKLMDMFGDSLNLPLENSLLGKLDKGEVFLAGKTKRGNVYLMGGDMGVQGKLISVKNDTITIYDGMCEIGFGN